VTDLVALLTFWVDARVVEPGAEVSELGFAVGRHVPDDGQDGAADGDDGFLLPAPSGDAPERLPRKVSVLPMDTAALPRTRAGIGRRDLAAGAFLAAGGLARGSGAPGRKVGHVR
jgi:hypothetical protein